MSLERLGKEHPGKEYKGCVRHIEIEKPVLGNNTADAQRLEQALKKELGTQLEKEGGNQGVSIPWHLLKNLPTFLRRWDYKARAVLFKDRRSWRLVDLIPPNLPYDSLPDAGLAGTDLPGTGLAGPGFPGPALTESDPVQTVLGAAIDLGTTRVVIQLLDLESGKTLGEIGFDNPQVVIGPDVLARIHHSHKPGGLEQLQKLLVDGVNEHLSRLCRGNGCETENIYLVTGAGNTAMTHLFLGQIGRAHV